MPTGMLLTMAGRATLLAVAAGLLISCASAATQGLAADRGRTGGTAASGEGPIPVLVLGEDRGATTLSRHDPAFRRVLGELQDALARRGFRVVDEDAVAAGLGWGRADGRDRLDLLELARLANASERAADRVRAAVLFRIDGTVRDLPYTTRVEVQLSGELVDVAANRFLGAFALPPETVSTAGRCAAEACASGAVAERARDLATELGAVLARRLAHLAPPVAGDTVAGDTALEAVYTLTLRHLEPEDAMAILEVMTDGFPGYRSHALIRRGGPLRRYEYVTTADPATLERWLTLLLVDMGLDPDGPVTLSVRPGEIRIERVLPPAADAVPRRD